MSIGTVTAQQRAEITGSKKKVQYNTRSLTIVIRTGELPLSIGRLKANGCSANLYGNNGFTLSSDTSTVEGATKLDFGNLDLRGMLRCLCSFSATQKEAN